MSRRAASIRDHVRDDWGVTFLLSPHGEAVVVGGPIENASDLKGYQPPRIDKSDLMGLSFCVGRFKGARAAVLSVQDPFRRSWNLVGGMPNLLIRYRSDPDLVHQIARIVTDYTLEALDLGAELVIFDHNLTPAQARAIAAFSDLKVIDRTQLILDPSA